MKYKGAFIGFLILTLGAVAGTIVCFVSKDSFVMYNGIRAFRILSRVLIGACVGTGAGTAISAIAFVKDHQNRLNEIVVEQQAIEERQRLLEETKAGLSVSGRIDPAYIREALMNETGGKWQCFREQIDSCISQFEQMDSYQERFARLLENNGAKTLRDTENVIDEVEQYMCKNARSVINFMSVADEDASDKVRQKIEDCREENSSLLQQTRDFIYAMTDFLNNQGEKADTRLLESYRETLLSSVNRSGNAL